MSKKKVVVVISARNEEKFISKTIDSLLAQSLSPELIVVVDDGSTDNTAKIARKYKKKGVILIIRDERIGGPSLLGTPMMAIPFNMAFNYIENSKIDFDYIMISGADCVYQIYYIENLIKRLDEKSKLVVVSGFQHGESLNRDHARGAGRIIKKSFWQIYGSKYPYPSYLWESGIIFTAQMHGLQVRGYRDVFFTSQRISGTNINMIRYGRMLRAIKYPFLIVIGRAVRIIKKTGIKSAIDLLAGYCLKPIQSFKVDRKISEFISKHYLIQKIRNFFLRYDKNNLKSI